MAYMINRQAPQSGLANLLALKGRMGDTELVHMTKPEVAALQATGQLTVNPSTGLPEAFKLKDILPTLAAVGVGFASGGTGFFAGPLGQALAAGGTSLAVNKGDLGKASMDALMAFGGAKLGQMLGGAQVPTGEQLAATRGIEAAQMSVDPGLSQALAEQTVTQQSLTQPSLLERGLSSVLPGYTPADPTMGYQAQLAQLGAGKEGIKLTGAELAKSVGIQSALPVGAMVAQELAPRMPEPEKGKMMVVDRPRSEENIYRYGEDGEPLTEERIRSAFMGPGPVDPLKFYDYRYTPATFKMIDRPMNEGGQVMEPASKYNGSGMFSGMVKGPDTKDGMDDNLLFKIKGGGPTSPKNAALSQDEYVVDAYTVSALGNGSSDAGARILDEFREEVRKKAFGKKKQPNQINARKIVSQYA